MLLCAAPPITAKALQREKLGELGADQLTF